MFTLVFLDNKQKNILTKNKQWQMKCAHRTCQEPIVLQMSLYLTVVKAAKEYCERQLNDSFYVILRRSTCSGECKFDVTSSKPIHVPTSCILRCNENKRKMLRKCHIVQTNFISVTNHSIRTALHIWRLTAYYQ